MKSDPDHNSLHDSFLNQEEQKILLQLARQSLRRHLEGLSLPELESSGEHLQEHRGAFITVRNSGTLRGCIGHVRGKQALWKTVREMSISAGTDDPRFSPVTLNELPELQIEISVLTLLQKIVSSQGIQAIQIGRDGLYVVQGQETGLLLPQVASEWKWTAEQFLEFTCEKAGLAKSAWKQKDVQLFTFQAQVLSES